MVGYRRNKPGAADSEFFIMYRQRGFVPKGGRFWQDRFWEHTVRDDDDRERCVEYIHYNPVKHGIVNAPREWKYSSFQKYV